jgi:septal ring factor EnvC (AmiA/AmiB activator)
LSPLTKLFVVLQVILSIALTAAVIVYVSKEDVQLNTLRQTEQKLQAAQTELAAANSARAAAEANLTAVQSQASQQLTAANTAVTAAQQQIADLNVQLAKASTSNAQQALDNSRLTEGLKASQQTTAQLNQTVAQLRESSDNAVRQAAEMSATISDLTNRYDVTERERRFLAEQLATIQQSGQGPAASSGNNAGSAMQAGAAQNVPQIKGVIRDRRNIAGVEYATISVGSADSVSPGTVFRIIQDGQFLGTLTVDTVELQESTGRLEGPRLNDVKPGTNVQTQYQ